MSKGSKLLKNLGFSYYPIRTAFSFAIYMYALAGFHAHVNILYPGQIGILRCWLWKRGKLSVQQPTTNYSNLHKAQSPKLELNLSHIGGRWSLLTTMPFLCHPCSLLSFTLESLRDINMHIWLCLIFTAFLLVLFFNVGKEMFLERVRRLHTKNFFKKYASLPTCWKTRVSPVLLFCLVTNQYII